MGKNYKEFSSLRGMGKKAQVTIFVIVGILIVVGGILVYYFYPNITGVLGREVQPNTFLRDCVEEDLESYVDTLAKQGGYGVPEGYVMFRGERVKYLCYTSEYFKPCMNIEPLLKKHFEEELTGMFEERADVCYQELRDSYERRGYALSGAEEVDAQVKLFPGKIIATVGAPLTMTKDEVVQSFTGFDISFDSKMYDLLMIATSIIDYESTYGDAATDLYMRYYPNLRIEKTKLMDVGTVYTLTEVTTGDEFVFATRGLIFPPGFGIE